MWGSEEKRIATWVGAMEFSEPMEYSTAKHMILAGWSISLRES